MNIILRAHHGLCTQSFVGKGYNSEFIKRMYLLINRLNKNNNVYIKLTCTVDSICLYCPNNISGICTNAEQVKRYDKACLSLLELQENTYLKWKEYKSMIYEKVVVTGKWIYVCQDCEWITTCKNALL